jgi:hypothetical protein
VKLSKTNKILIMLIFLCTFCLSTSVLADGNSNINILKDKTISDIHKVWIINFNQPIDVDSFANVIQIKDLTDGTIYQMIPVIGDTEDSIKINYPGQGYTVGHSYQLLITNIKSQDCKNLNMTTLMNFDVVAANSTGSSNNSNIASGSSAAGSNNGIGNSNSTTSNSSDNSVISSNNTASNSGNNSVNSVTSTASNNYIASAKIVVSPILSILKQITLNSVNFPGVTKARIDGTNKVFNVGETTALVTDGTSATIYFYGDDGVTVLAKGTLDISQSTDNETINLVNGN